MKPKQIKPQVKKHTTTPWQISVEAYPEPRMVKIGTGDDGWLGVASVFGDTQEEAEANADLIVKAVNNFDEMIAALEACKKAIPNVPRHKEDEWDYVLRRAFLAVSAALFSVKGDPK